MIYIWLHIYIYTRISKRVSNKHPLERVSIRHPLIFKVLNKQIKGFAADKGPLEFDSRVLGDLVLPLIVWW